MIEEIENEDQEYFDNEYVEDFLKYFIEKNKGKSTPLICGK